ncbi:hypothetical protein OG384_04165 [Streptomyces sp. NBC_01324]|uniref:hypothetical protein n=1 Tax=Streptomyces sp. NBC_01324 TaxID=2903826 RepID=UPI002E0D1CC8|nr:hypothetical protein OG384_04165 [Streptomyces sp. NBC_01324]
MSPKKLRLADLRRDGDPEELVTVAEFDVTPGLHEWIEEQAAAPDADARWSRATRKILAAHPYTTTVINPQYGPHTAGFGCETCHDWDGVPEGRGNCATILALAEAYGLDDEETA